MHERAVSAAGPDTDSLNAIASGLVGGGYGPFPQELMGHLGSTDEVLTPGSAVPPHKLGSTAVGRESTSIPGTVQPLGVDVAGGVRRHWISPRRPDNPDLTLAHPKSGHPDDTSVDLNAKRESLPAFAPICRSTSTTSSPDPLTAIKSLLWLEENREPDDYLHNPDPFLDQLADKHISVFSGRGWTNAISLFVIAGGTITLFSLWPVMNYVLNRARYDLGWNLGGVNASGQYPAIPNLPQLIDRDTPDSAKTRIGFDGEEYELVFSDEFNTPGRTFWAGDDPFWEAVDIHYWQNQNYEWLDPDAVRTKDGSLEITLSEQPLHDLSFRSGMIQSWNQFCFTEGYIEVNVSLPGRPSVTGMWPAAWTMGNLARAGFGASNDGMWPYSYEACDVGTLPNQTWPDGTSPDAAKHSGSSDYGGELSYLTGQRTSSCTCKGEEHPGPTHNTGRSGPEIDILEFQYGYGPSGSLGSASQSLQIGPMDAAYAWDNTSAGMSINGAEAEGPAASGGTFVNPWHGSVSQESLSGITITDGTAFEGAGWQTFGYEYKRGYTSDGAHITWSYNGQPTWTVKAGAIGANAESDISARPISMEPMYIILNLGLSNKFQTVMWDQLNLPVVYRVDYVRVFQRKGSTNVGCNPKDYPTTDYIRNHMTAYTNANATTWAQAGYAWPKNSLHDPC